MKRVEVILVLLVQFAAALCEAIVPYKENMGLRTKKGKKFTLADGTVIHSLHELSRALALMPDQVYEEHVKGDTSEIARWVRDSCGKSDLADELEHADTKDVALVSVMAELFKSDRDKPLSRRRNVRHLTSSLSSKVNSLRIASPPSYSGKKSFFSRVRDTLQRPSKKVIEDVPVNDKDLPHEVLRTDVKQLKDQFVDAHEGRKETNKRFLRLVQENAALRKSVMRLEDEIKDVLKQIARSVDLFLLKK